MSPLGTAAEMTSVGPSQSAPGQQVGGLRIERPSQNAVVEGISLRKQGEGRRERHRSAHAGTQLGCQCPGNQGPGSQGWGALMCVNASSWIPGSPSNP